MAILKKISVIYFFIWMIIPQDALLFVTSFPAHYAHHLEDHGKISLLEFLKEHSQGVEKHDASDNEEDTNFPCDHHHNESCGYSLHNFKILPATNDWLPYIPLQTCPAIPLTVYFSNEQVSSIWQPPKSTLVFNRMLCNT